MVTALIQQGVMDMETKFTRMKLSGSAIASAEKEYKKWINSSDADIPEEVLKQIEISTLIIDALDSQVQKDASAIEGWGKDEWCSYGIGSITALKFRKALVKIFDKEYPKHLEETLVNVKKILLSRFNIDLETYKMKNIPIAIPFDFTTTQ